MEKVIQLNLFGEIPSLIDHDYDILSQRKEKGNTHGQSKSSSRALEKLSTNNVPGTTTERQTGRRNSKRSGAIQTSLWEFDRIGNVPPRSTRDASSSVHPVRTRTELRGAGTRRLNTDDCGNFSISLAYLTIFDVIIHIITKINLKMDTFYHLTDPKRYNK